MEPDWGISADVDQMLVSLEGRVSDRKLTLFACACVRRVLHLANHPPSGEAIEVAEGFTDGLRSAEDLAHAHQLLPNRAPLWEQHEDEDSLVISAACFASDPYPLTFSAPHAALWVRQALSTAHFKKLRHRFRKGRNRIATDPREWQKAAIAEFDSESGCQVMLLRDIFGDALQALTVPSSSNYGPTATQIAQRIYDRRTFEDLQILADALEEAGCDNADILNHFRQPGEHVRGCWALDAVLGKD